MNIMNKGIAVNTILMLLVGIIVVGIIVILLYRYVIGAPLGQAECKARLISWCSGCKLACGDTWNTACGFYPGNDVGTSTGCAYKYFTITITDGNANNNKCGGHIDDCKAFTGG
jgi:hypothetical protein